MKQTVEEAAHSFAESRSSGSAFPAYYQGFIAGAEWQKGISSAEWQAKQSPWISVEERLPEELESVLVGTNYEGRYYYEVAFVMNGKWVCHNSKPICWMPIPSFDEILEDNNDVLERIKEKGD